MRANAILSAQYSGYNRLLADCSLSQFRLKPEKL